MLAVKSKPAISNSHQPKSRTFNTIEATAFIPPLALHIVTSIVEAKAEKALPLVLAIHRQLYMTKRETTPLNVAVWKAAGSSSLRERVSIMRKLSLGRGSSGWRRTGRPPRIIAWAFYPTGSWIKSPLNDQYSKNVLFRVAHARAYMSEKATEAIMPWTVTRHTAATLGRHVTQHAPPRQRGVMLS